MQVIAFFLTSILTFTIYLIAFLKIWQFLKMTLKKTQYTCLLLLHVMSLNFLMEIQAFRSTSYVKSHSIDLDQIYLGYLNAFQKKLERNTFTRADQNFLYIIVKIQNQRKREKQTVDWYSRQGRWKNILIIKTIWNFFSKFTEA